MLAAVACLPFLVRATSAWSGDASPNPDLRWYEAAKSMLRQAESSGDQPYGAVLVLADTLRRRRDRAGSTRAATSMRTPEREDHPGCSCAGSVRKELPGAVLYSTSRLRLVCARRRRPRPGVSRMYFGPST